MKKMMYLVLSIILFYACQKQKEINGSYKEIDGFLSSHDIKGEALSLNVDILFPRKIFLFNQATIAVMDKKGEYGVKLLEITSDSINLITKLGRKGGGPDDVQFGITNIQKDTFNSSEGIWLSDIESVKFYPYNNQTDEWQNTSINIKKLPTKIIPGSESFVLKSRDILGVSSAFNNHIFIYSDENESLSGYDFYPVIPNPYDSLTSKTLFSGDIGLKPDKSQLVLTYELFKSLCIVDVDNLSDPLFLKFKDTPFPKIDMNDGKLNVDAMRNLPIQYIDVYTSDRFIYSLYVNKTEKELSNYSSGSPAMSIHIFDWEGTALCSLNLDRIINCFCVDEKNNIIYGIDPTGEENGVFYRFALPENVIN